MMPISGKPEIGARPPQDDGTGSVVPLFCALFFHCFSLFLRRRIFTSLGKALHCNWRASSIVNRLYFFRKNFCPRSTPPEGRGGTARGQLSPPRNACRSVS